MKFRWLIAGLLIFRTLLFAYFVLRHGAYIVNDTGPYVDLAQNLLQFGEFSRSEAPPFVPEIFRTPGYPVFLAVINLIGIHDPYAILLCQELIYLLSVLIFFTYGREVFGQNMTAAATVFMLVDPSGLYYPKQFLSEVLFMPFVLGGVLAIGHYSVRNNWRYLLLAGGLFGIGAMVRPALTYFPLLAAGVLLLFHWCSRRVCWHTGLFLLCFSLMLTPWLARNYYHFGKLFMSGQASNLFANYQIADLWQTARGIPYYQGQKLIARQLADSVNRQSQKLQRPLDVVEIYHLQLNFALHEILKYPGAYLLQTGFGVLKTMIGTNLTEMYTALRLPGKRANFYDQQDAGFFAKVNGFLRAQSGFELSMILFRILLAGFALLGVLPILRSKNCVLWMILLSNIYFISIPGSVGVSRFRFPVEVFWFMQAYIGLLWIWGIFIQWRQPGKNSVIN